MSQQEALIKQDDDYPMGKSPQDQNPFDSTVRPDNENDEGQHLFKSYQEKVATILKASKLEMTADQYMAKNQFGETYIDDSLIDNLNEVDLSTDQKKKIIHEAERNLVKKLSPMQTYFSLVKGFIAIGILYAPKNFYNGGWLWACITMFLSFLLTLFCIMKLIEARTAVGGGSFSDIGYKAFGQKGKITVDIFMAVQQIGFVIGMVYFVITSLKEVVDDAFEVDSNIIYFGKNIHVNHLCKRF